MTLTALVFGTAYAAITLYAVCSDAWRMIIPNWVSVGLAVLFAAYALLHQDLPVVAHTATAVIVFAVTTGLYAAGWFGGGDVKFLSATALWAGPGLLLPIALAMSVIGLVLAIVILLARRSKSGIDESTVVRSGIELRGPRAWVASGACPYGIAIGVPALTLLAPRILGM